MTTLIAPEKRRKKFWMKLIANPPGPPEPIRRKESKMKEMTQNQKDQMTAIILETGKRNAEKYGVTEKEGIAMAVKRLMKENPSAAMIFAMSCIS